jgi:hypothetical protein
MILLPIMGNMALSGNIADGNAVDAVIEQLRDRLPTAWTLKRVASGGRSPRRPSSDIVAKLSDPAGGSVRIAIEAKSQVEPQNVDSVAERARTVPAGAVLVAAPFLSPRTRERLKAAGLNYADLTGNIRLALSMPALFIDARGADVNPEPVARERRSLKGPKAGRLVRALCDFRPPIGLRELAKRAKVDAGYASRIVQVLVREALVARTSRGPITSVDWAALLQRWSEQYSPLKSDRVTWYLAPRGLNSAVDILKTLKKGYVVSGSCAANLFAPVAPARLLLCYADDVPKLANTLDLRQVESGMNVALVRPFDPIVTERTSRRDGLTVAALPQVVADLLTSPGRGPNEAEALMEWMRENESVWRA